MKNLLKVVYPILFVLYSTISLAIPKLSSYSTATATIYLDFDGHYVSGTLWNNGQSFYCNATLLTDAQITSVFNTVAEDFRPFNVNITTDSTKFLNAPISQRIRIIVTPTSSWKPSVGGISYIGSFTWGDDTPGFVFSDRLSNNPKFIAECCSHESGHTLGLAHQSTYDNNCNLVETYNTGTGSGETSWAPIMGSSYNKNMTGWNDGATPYGCYNTQDNLALITSANGFSYRADDYTDLQNNSATTISSGNFSVNGIISTTSDKDVFKIAFNQQTAFHLNGIPNIDGTSNTNADLDIKILLYNETHTLIKTYDPSNTLSISIDTSLKTGTYYLVIDGTGNQFAGDYGSLGSYKLTGYTTTLAIKSITLSGKTEAGTDQLQWTTEADENISNELVEFSSNGIDFHTINAISNTSRSTSYPAGIFETRYYRIKSVSVSGAMMYSNILVLKGSTLSNNHFEVSTLFNQQIKINTTQNYTYQLTDMNGRILLRGKGINGTNYIDGANLSSGMYVITIIGERERISKKIMKQ